jgi:voltage-gated sodium channel
VFILVSTFMALNLFIGVVVGALDAETAAEAPKLTHAAGSEERVLEELKALRSEVMLLRAEMKGRHRDPARGGIHAA